MTKLINVFRILGRKLTSVFSARHFHREIALVSSTVEDSGGLARALLTTTQDEARALQSLDDYACGLLTSKGRGTSQEETAGEVVSFAANYLTRGKRGKLRRWMFHLPTWRKTGEEQEKHSWKRQADTFIVCWPYRNFDQDDTAFQDISFHLFGSVGDARARGRLRRLAVAVTDIPRNIGPHHPTQCRLDLRDGGSLQNGLRKILTETEGQPGNPLADPIWREFLGKAILGDKNFSKLMETMRRALNRKCPLFFVSETPETSPGLESMLDWIENKSRTGATRAGRFVRGLRVAATLALISIVLVGFQLPGPTRGGQQRFVGSSPDSLRDEINARLDGYKRVYGLAGYVVGDSTAQPALLSSLLLVKNKLVLLENERHAGQLNECARSAVQCAIALTKTARADTSQSLARIVTEEDSLRKARMFDATQAGLVFGGNGQLENAISRGAFWAALLSYQYDDSTGRFVSLGTVADKMTAVLDSLGQTHVGAFLDSLSSTTSGLAFCDTLQNGLEQENIVSLYLHEAMAANVMPGLDPNGIVAGIEQKSLENVIDNRRAYEAQLELIGRFACLFCDSIPPLFAPAHKKAESLRRRINDVLKPREVIVFFTCPYDQNWHVDVKTRRDAGGWRPAQWTASDKSRGCAVKVNVAPGEVIWVRLNNESPHHRTLIEGAPCTDGGEVKTHKLTEQKGTLTINGRRIGWEATTDDPPEWPPLDQSTPDV